MPAPLRPRARLPSVVLMNIATRLLRDTGYVLSGFVLAVLGFVVVVAGLSTGVGLVVVWVGLPVLAGTFVLLRGLAQAERLRLRALQGRAASLDAYTRPPEGASRVRRVLHPLTDPQSWLDALWALVGFVTGTTAFVVVAAWWAAAGAGLTYWFWQQWLPADDTSLAELIGLGEGRVADSLVQFGLGLVALVTLPWVVRGAAAVHAGLADLVLCGRARVQHEQVAAGVPVPAQP